MEGPRLGPGREDITWPDQVAPRGRKAASGRKFKPQTSNLVKAQHRGLLAIARDGDEEGIPQLSALDIPRHMLLCPSLNV